MKTKSPRRIALNLRQRGHASLLFVLIFPALFGMFVWGAEGARIMQDDARLADAMEVAGLAVAAQNSDNQATQQATAKKFIQTYFTNGSANITPTVTKLTCEQNANCDQNDPNEARFFEYRITATVTRDTWFNDGAGYVSYGKQYAVKDKSVSRKYQSQAVDVVLVADYSASMFEYWRGGSKRKFQDLNDIIADVAKELKTFNEQNKNQVNKIAVVPFDFYTSEKVIDRRGRVKRMFAAHVYCSSRGCNSYSPYNNVNATTTVSKIFELNDSIHQYEWKEREVTNISVFENIYLTSNFQTDVINRISDSRYFNISSGGGSGTSSYTGLIRGAQVAAMGTNPRRLIIILSDGVDSYSGVTISLISAGLCSTIIDQLNSLKSGDDNVKAKLAAVGFDYDIDSNPQMSNCVGENNVYKAENRADIKNKILELISEEIGHLAE
jgi:tight adherence protein G